jgi:hypothetical protein
MGDNLLEFIKKAIQQEVERVTEEELAAVKERIERRKAEVIASVVLYVQQEVSFRSLGRELVITVRKETK